MTQNCFCHLSWFYFSCSPVLFFRILDVLKKENVHCYKTICATLKSSYMYWYIFDTQQIFSILQTLLQNFIIALLPPDINPCTLKRGMGYQILRSLDNDLIINLKFNYENCTKIYRFSLIFVCLPLKKHFLYSTCKCEKGTYRSLEYNLRISLKM